MEIDCGKYMRLGQMLNNSQLRDHIIRSIKEEELAKVEHLATACKVIIDEERDQSAVQIHNVSLKNNQMMAYKMAEIPIKRIDKTFPSLNSTNRINAQNLKRQPIERKYTRLKRADEKKEKLFQRKRKPESLLFRYCTFNDYLVYCLIRSYFRDMIKLYR